ncbi:hypothetical protein M406DRAFT_284956 [Cryphonectria parasitica EP155]|uniref:DUF7053 domain-containing protein n=1 Tax=Cryphonectria parasitica (strain ATCC 38755 / EP155) TaxID=660469 RepID=A0A9P5CTH0_CRYP1|nr:uncharacterized protein M406DRAFT_284956 [Cryphonectria parasitica EP155]KAF3770328.1 hypothetical protein M406DRAFT_284956 [Cryphonectria parasitica EP155]
MLRKKEVFTIITPIPGFIPRQLAIDILHSHSEVIAVNPLVLDHKPIKAPRNAAADEYYSTWYEISQKIQFVPGIGKIGSGKISFNGCFHDMPWGLQTHIYAPMNVDLKNRYRIAGNQPGIEPPEPQELGLGGAPSDGLYLKDDVEIKCNVAMVSFVKSQLKTASKEMVDRIIRKAELLDRGDLHAMIENGKLRTINPNDRTNTITSSGSMSPPPQHSPTFKDRTGTISPEPRPYQVPRPSSYQQFAGNRHPQADQNAQSPHWSAPYGGIHQAPSQRQKAPAPLVAHAELPAATPTPPAAAVEMPGDFCYPPQASPGFAPPQPSPTYTSDRESNFSLQSSRASPQPLQHARWSQGSETSGGSSAMYSPGLPPEHLPTHDEAPEQEHAFNNIYSKNQNNNAKNNDGEAPPPNWDAVAARRAQYVTSTPPPSSRSYAYNPADYANVRRGSPMGTATYGQNQ